MNTPRIKVRPNDRGGLNFQTLTNYERMVQMLEELESNPTSVCTIPQFGYKDRDGYPVLKSGLTGKTVRMCRAVLTHVVGEPTENQYALHSCDNPQCVNPQHLRWGSPKENANDRQARGRSVVSHRNGAPKLTLEQVSEMVAARRAGETVQSIADRYGVHNATVSRASRGVSRHQR